MAVRDYDQSSVVKQNTYTGRRGLRQDFNEVCRNSKFSPPGV